MLRVEALQAYLFLGAVMAVVFAWSWHYHFWSNSPTARRSRSPLWLGFSATTASIVFFVAGIIGFNLSQHGRFVSGSNWAGGVIWSQIVVGLVLAPVAIYLL